jgi:hypothetical protein
MRFPLLVLALALLPLTAGGALTLRVEDVTVCPGQTTFAEVYFEETAPAQNERLNVYAIRLGIAGDGGVRFGPAAGVGQTENHPFVLTSRSATVEAVEVTDRSLFAFVHDPLVINGVDVTDGAGALRFPVTVLPGTPAGQASLVFDLDLPPDAVPTDFTNEIGDVIPVTLQNGTVTICPEPTSTASALFAAALVTLRRGPRVKRRGVGSVQRQPAKETAGDMPAPQGGPALTPIRRATPRTPPSRLSASRPVGPGP